MAATRSKPSKEWRAGWFLFDGWPAQEGGTDSHLHPRRDSHDVLQPAARGSSYLSRYPSWWPVDPEEEEPPPRRAAATAPVVQAAVPAAKTDAAVGTTTKDVATDTTAEAPWSPPPRKQAQTSQGGTSVTAQAQTSCDKHTQTARLEPKLRRLRKPLMPCMQAQPSRQPAHPNAPRPVQSRVGAELKREAALRAQLEAARRHRLQSMVARAPVPDEPEPPTVLSITQRFLETGLATEFTDGELSTAGVAHAQLYEPAPAPLDAALLFGCRGPVSVPTPGMAGVAPPLAAPRVALPETAPPPALRANLGRSDHLEGLPPEEDPTLASQWLGDFSAVFKGEP